MLGPLQVIYNQECLTFSRLNDNLVTRYDVCSLACKEYTAALFPTILLSAFAKAGIFPFQTTAQITESLGNKILPSELYSNKDIPEENNKETDTSKTTADNEQQTEKLNENKTHSHKSSETCDEVLVQQGGIVAKKLEKKEEKEYK